MQVPLAASTCRQLNADAERGRPDLPGHSRQSVLAHELGPIHRFERFRRRVV